MLDLDDFKAVNDGYGYLVGDEALALFGRAIKTVCRSSDISGRFGGEEFIILLPDASDNQAIQFTQRLYKYICSLNIRNNKNTITLTVNIGALMHLMHPRILIHQSHKLIKHFNEGKDCTGFFSLDNK